MTSPLPNTITDIITKVRRLVARSSANQITDQEIVRYVNTFYVYDFPEHLRSESLLTNYQFTTSANIPVYDFPTDIYLTENPPVYVGGYECYSTQFKREFLRIIPQLNYIQQSIYTGTGTSAAYTGQFLTAVPVYPGFKPNPPGAFSTNACQAKFINWNVIVSGVDTNGNTQTLVDDGQGNLISPTDPATPPSAPVILGSVNYTTGALNLSVAAFSVNIASGNPINVQYIPYVASRPIACLFFQDQIQLYPVPDQAYTVSFEAYKYPLAFNSDDAQGEVITVPQLKEWWQLLAYGAAEKIFTDLMDIENVQKVRPFLEEQLKLVTRRTIVQQTQRRTPTIYSQDGQFGPNYYQNWFGNY